MTRRRYSNEEKLNIINECNVSGNIAATAKKYSVADATIHGWIKQFNKKKPENDLNAEIKKLRRQLSDANLENAILKDLVKKTVQVWSHDDKSLMSLSPGNILRQKY